jgi:hypothetical protein
LPEQIDIRLIPSRREQRDNSIGQNSLKLLANTERFRFALFWRKKNKLGQYPLPELRFAGKICHPPII